MDAVNSTPTRPRKRTTQVSAAALAAFTLLAACSSDGDVATSVVSPTTAPSADVATTDPDDVDERDDVDDAADTEGAGVVTSEPDDETETEDEAEGDEMVSSMPLVSAMPIPEELTALTGIAWNESLRHFVAVSDSGQIASLDGDTLATLSVIDSGATTLTDITVDSDGLVALTPTGERLIVAMDAVGVLQVTDIQVTSLDFEPQGVVVSSELDGPLVSRDTADGPSLWAVDGDTANESLQLDDSTLTTASSLAVINGKFLASDAGAPTVAIFDEDGSFAARLGAEGMSSIEGITNRDGTFVFVGNDSEGLPVLASYNLTDGQEIEPDPAAGPATLNDTLLATDEVALPDRITQPSGIAHDAESDSILINTDQGEFFALSPDLAEIRFDFDVPGFNQGNIEDIHVTGPGEAAMVVEDASYIPFRFDGTTWSPGEQVVVDAQGEDVSAIGYDSSSNQLVYIAEDGPGKSLILTTLDGEFVDEREIETSAIGIENLDDYTVAGISSYDGVLYVLSEQFSTVFTMTLDGEVTNAYGLADVEEPSGLTVYDDAIWVVLDHEDSEPAPPMVRYPLPQEPEGS